MTSPATPTGLGDEITDLLVKFRREAADSGARTYAAAVIGAVRESVARDIEAERLTPVGAAAMAVWAMGYTDGLNAAVRIARGSS